jgi:hypothetical protein
METHQMGVLLKIQKTCMQQDENTTNWRGIGFYTSLLEKTHFHLGTEFFKTYGEKEMTDA